MIIPWGHIVATKKGYRIILFEVFFGYKHETYYVKGTIFSSVVDV